MPRKPTGRTTYPCPVDGTQMGVRKTLATEINGEPVIRRERRCPACGALLMTLERAETPEQVTKSMINRWCRGLMLKFSFKSRP